MSEVRVAMIGAGVMANRVHYPSLAGFSNVELVGVCDLDRARCDGTADRWGIPGRFADYRLMLDELRPDAVYAIGQPHLLFDVWVDVLRRRVPLCIEKPMGITLHQARILRHLAEQGNVVTQVSFQRRSSPLLRSLRERCLSRGAITQASCEFYKNQPGPFLNARDHMLDDCVHALDTVRWLCGGEVRRVQSVSRALDTPDLNFIQALIEFDNGSTGVVMCNWTSGRRVFRAQIHAPVICAEADLDVGGRLFADGDLAGELLTAAEAAGSEELHRLGGFEAKNREFIDAVQSGVPPESNFSDAYKTMELAERILAANLLGPT